MRVFVFIISEIKSHSRVLTYSIAHSLEMSFEWVREYNTEETQAESRKHYCEGHIIVTMKDNGNSVHNDSKRRWNPRSDR